MLIPPGSLEVVSGMFQAWGGLAGRRVENAGDFRSLAGLAAQIQGGPDDFRPVSHDPDAHSGPVLTVQDNGTGFQRSPSGASVTITLVALPWLTAFNKASWTI